MRSVLAFLLVVTFFLGAALEPARAEPRIALLIGNKGYSSKVGPLKNPHNDIDLVSAALTQLHFEVTILKDATYREIDTALKHYVRTINRAGRGAISFFYFSGHGVANPETQINYLIPVDVTDVVDDRIWDEALQQNVIIDLLSKQAPNATNFVVFDACRNELNLTGLTKKGLGTQKGFVAIQQTSGLLIAYATAPKLTATDSGEGGGPYAKALSAEILKPGIEAVTMFRNVQLRVKQEIGQDPWLSFPSLPPVYFAGSEPPTQVELAFWASVKDSTNPVVLGTYLGRYPNGDFATIARALIDHYEHQLKAEQAARAEDQTRLEEERKAAELRRIEVEQRAQEAALEAERGRAEEAKNSVEMQRVVEQQRAQLIAREQELRKALEEVAAAREAAKIAEKERIAMTKAAEQATQAAEQAIATKRAAVGASDATTVAALPKLEKVPAASQFDGDWDLHRLGPGCAVNSDKIYQIRITRNVISGQTGTGPIAGSILATGLMKFSHAGVSRDHRRMGTVYYSGSIQGDSGSGNFNKPGTSCQGTFTAKRNVDADAGLAAAKQRDQSRRAQSK